MRDSDVCVRCDHRRYKHSRLPASAEAPARAWCAFPCKCEGFVMLTEYDAGDREWTARKKLA